LSIKRQAFLFDHQKPVFYCIRRYFFADTSFMLIRFILYGAIGCLMEVFWTGMGSLMNKDYKLRSTTSIWMFFIYGMVVFLEPIYLLMQSFPIVLRGIIYALCIFMGEYIIGGGLKRVDLCPWDYTHCRYNVQGVIRLDYAPAWFAAGLIFERVFVLLGVA